MDKGKKGQRDKKTKEQYNNWGVLAEAAGRSCGVWWVQFLLSLYNSLQTATTTPFLKEMGQRTST